MLGLKKIDITLIVFSIIGIVISFLVTFTGEDSKTLIIYTDQKKMEYSLENAQFKVKSKTGSVTVKVQDGRVKVVESTCPDKWCVKMGWIDDPGESIICLPSRIMVAIEGKGKKQKFDTTTR